MSDPIHNVASPRCVFTALVAALTLVRSAAVFGGEALLPASADPEVTLASLLAEMTDPYAVARLPVPHYESLQASSYNRASVHRDRPGWFADSDGSGFVRTEEIGGKTEWVIMEHDGPGCISKIWTPFFYYDFSDRTGPNIRIYLDGQAAPAVDENLIELVTAKRFVKPPFAAYTARAGNAHLPIPFARRCKVTLTEKPFYYILNYRSYPAGTRVASFNLEQLRMFSGEVEAAGKRLYRAERIPADATLRQAFTVPRGGSKHLTLPAGPAAVGWFSIRGATDGENAEAWLRSTVLTLECDGERTVWCPVGDFFCCPDSIHPYHSWQRSVSADGTMTCRWPMPYGKAAVLGLENHGKAGASVEVQYGMVPWKWDERSMHFHANWRADELLPGTPIRDWNFIDICGRGVLVGDAWTVLNPTHDWWGEGDEKIYVDDAWDRGFPTHFGTGTEDYYGWAGGVVPTREDEFDEPLLANIRVGGTDGNSTRGFNICTRTRSLDAIPFRQRLCFDMEASPGTGQRRPSDFQGYSAVTFWYGGPGAEHNRPPLPEAAARPIMSLADIATAARRVGSRTTHGAAIECELLTPSAVSPGLGAGPQRPAEVFGPEQWSGQSHFFIPAKNRGDFVEFTLTEQFQPRTIVLRATTSYDFGVAAVAVNGRTVFDHLDLFSERPAVKEIVLGKHAPINNRFLIRYELVAPNPRSRGAKTYLGLDSILLVPLEK